MAGKVRILDGEGKVREVWPIDAKEAMALNPDVKLLGPGQDTTIDIVANTRAGVRETHDQLNMKKRVQEAEERAAEAARKYAEALEKEAETREELAQSEMETGEPTTPQIMPSTYLDEEQPHFRVADKYRRHNVDMSNPPPEQGSRTPHIASATHDELARRAEEYAARAAALRSMAEEQAAQGGQAAAPRRSVGRPAAPGKSTGRGKAGRTKAEKDAAKAERRARKTTTTPTEGTDSGA